MRFSHTAHGLLLMTVAMLVAPGMDSIAKYISGTIPAIEVGTARFFFQFIYLAPIVIVLKGSGGIWPQLPLLNIIRALLMAAATVIFFTALKWMPVADAIAIFFVEPLILTVISAVFLNDSLSRLTGESRYPEAAGMNLGALDTGFRR